MGKTWFNVAKNWIILLQLDLKQIHKVNFYPSDNNFTQALLVCLWQISSLPTQYQLILPNIAMAMAMFCTMIVHPGKICNGSRSSIPVPPLISYRFEHLKPFHDQGRARYSHCDIRGASCISDAVFWNKDRKIRNSSQTTNQRLKT